MELNDIEQKLDFYIRPQYFPVAVKLLTQGEQLPEKARFPLRDFGHAIMACQGIGMARRYGWTVAMGKDDIICAGAAVGLGFVRKEELHAPPGLSIPFVFNRLKFGKYQYFVVSPIHSATFTPDVGANLIQFAVDGIEYLLDVRPTVTQPGLAGTPILYPSPNRVRDAQFTFDGQVFTFEPNSAD